MRLFPIVVIGLSLLGVVVFLLARESPVDSKTPHATEKRSHGELKSAAMAGGEVELPVPTT